jgi:hypothetical protein
VNKLAALLLLLALLLGAALRCRGFGDAFEDGARGINGSWYAGQGARHFEEFGFAVTRGVPWIASFPNTLEGGIPYVTHPAPMSWVFWLGTKLMEGERGIRLFPLLAALLSLPLCWWMLRRHATPLAAAVGVAVFAALPLTAYFGSIPSGEAFLLPWLFLFWMSAERWMRGASARGLVLLFVVGALLDWAFYWAVPALGMVTLVQGTWRKHWRVLLALFGVGCACVALTMLHMAWALGDFETLRAQWGAVVDAGVRTEDASGVFKAMGEHVLSVHGQVGVAVLVLLSVVPLIWRRGLTNLRGPMLFFVVVGVLHTLVFARHAAVHDFWLMSCMGLFACAAAALVDVADGRAMRLSLVLLVLGCAGFLGARTWRLGNERATTLHRERVASIPELAEEHCLALVEPFWIQEVWYSRAHVWPQLNTASALQLMEHTYATLYAQAKQRPSIVIVLERGRSDPEALALRRRIAELGVPAVARGPYDVYRLPGTG